MSCSPLARLSAQVEVRPDGPSPNLACFPQLPTGALFHGTPYAAVSSFLELWCSTEGHNTVGSFACTMWKLKHGHTQQWKGLPLEGRLCEPGGKGGGSRAAEAPSPLRAPGLHWGIGAGVLLQPSRGYLRFGCVSAEDIVCLD